MKRSFCVGSEWLYFKVYLGVKSADALLKDLTPYIHAFKEETLIDKWFFIRYRDPHEHLRLRFHCASPSGIFQVVERLHLIFDALLSEDVIWKVQIDTYQRELERYGIATMEASESIFSYDSDLFMNYLMVKPSFSRDQEQLLFSFVAIDGFLDAFLLCDTQKLSLLEKLQEAFKTEFQADKTLKKELDQNYRSIKVKAEECLYNKKLIGFQELNGPIVQRNIKVKCLADSVLNSLEIPLNDFLSSHIHMMLNRQFTSRQRYYELIVYDHLFRFYKTRCYHSKVDSELSLEIEPSLEVSRA
ncbi:thiopeptide-type bacteriocin biosynthesis protein [Flavobacterium sp. SM15]|uniref:thiopeptide-type bacteriocin biosynthesis protein n=1 Tax=Flavobacterium sp. SM15 TaxID=2908005 RepID=UPI001EDC3F1C|nr:thiopeptide-type bacteriocin biosynthesis protein [Flavobacterium sp. SM15]MCG2612220.1 thiopeptide-type bacteriocin biosynthesis protein [Flavobacterium sp. SM15]